jgi:hypothetical protein
MESRVERNRRELIRSEMDLKSKSMKDLLKEAERDL